MNKKIVDEVISSSFRDPSGFVFSRDGELYRSIDIRYKENYDLLIQSGLYEELLNSGLLIPHEEVNIENVGFDIDYKTIKPELIPFISYPYEWSFSQLKDAALTTLEIQKRSLDFGMSLKDCSAYNIQFRRGRPILIDSLSFEKYREGNPWVAYRQFCQHFLAPLALMSYVDARLNNLFRVYIDGIPLELASSLLPFSTRINFSLLCHIHLHARSQKHFANKSIKTNHRRMSLQALKGLIDNLESAIRKLKWRAGNTEWADYYEDTNYSSEALCHKKELVAMFIDKIKPKVVWDLGANTGLYSRIASDRGIQTIAFDIDPAAVERSYIESVRKGETMLLPLLLDLTNPSPDIGWENKERMSLFSRGPADMVLALALIHHLAISNNVPLNRIAGMFAKICNSLIIEFVPKSDSQVQRLLSSREDIFTEYSQAFFEKMFSKYFAIQDLTRIRKSERIFYLMKKKGDLI